MKLRILGCGTSTGVPRIGNDWGGCDPAEPKNRRRRVSILVTAGDTRVLVDTTPDMREQLLDAEVPTLDAVIWTHEHADHVHGIDDLRQLYLNSGAAIAGYASERTLASLRDRFGYAFDGKCGYPATIQAGILPETLAISELTIHAVEQPHGAITSTGLRFDHGGKSIGYSTDFKGLTEQMATVFDHLDVWVIDACRIRPHPTHCHLALALATIERLQPRRAILTHMDGSMDYRSLLRELPPHIEPGYDGMEIAL